MSKWKCEICDSEFENFHAQGFDHKIYCPLCYFKELYRQTELERERLNNIINELSNFIIKIYKKEMDKTSDWWLQEELHINFDDINLATNFKLEKELKEE